MLRTFNVYGLFDEKGEKIFEGTRDDFMDKYGINRNSVYSYLRNECKINGLYEIRIIGKVVKDTPGHRPKKEKRAWGKGWELKTEYEYLFHHLKYYGNTVSNFDPNPYLKQLKKDGLKCKVRAVEETEKRLTKRGRPRKPKYYYITEVVHG